MANFVSNSDAVTLMTAIGNKFAALGGAYIAKGSSAFADIPLAPAKAQRGFVYNITDEFTTDSRFVEGTGKVYPAGTNVVVVQTSADPEAYAYDVLGDFIDIAAIEDRIDKTQLDIAPEFDETVDYAVGDVVVYNDELYECTTAHTAAAFDSDNFTKTDVKSLIAAAEPDSLTAQQIEDLLALLD